MQKNYPGLFRIILVFFCYLGEVLRQTRSLQQVNQLSYDVFLSTITEVNKISGHFLDTNGKQLVFAVKKGTDSSFLWKATVRIACVKIGKKYALKRYDQFTLKILVIVQFHEIFYYKNK